MKSLEKTVSSTVVTMSELVVPDMANFLGNVFGGAILSLIDKVAYVTASRFAGTVCVTASFDRVDFLSPIEVGELVTLIGRVDYVGKTSIQTRIEVFAENIQKGTRRKTNSSIVTMVAIDENGHPTPAPKLLCETVEEKIRFLEGKLRRELRTVRRVEYEEKVKEFHSLSEPELDNLIESDAPLLTQ